MFIGAKLKIQRGYFHIGELEKRLDNFFSRKPFILMDIQSSKDLQRKIKVVQKENIPADFSLIIGDAIHNLRSALDYVVTEVLGDVGNLVQFPFCKLEADLDNELKKRKILGTSIETAIRSLKPYSEGNKKLYSLHKLDIYDKHKLILMVKHVIPLNPRELNKLDLGIPFRGNGSMEFHTDELFVITLRAVNRQERKSIKDYNKEALVQPNFRVCFADGQPFAGQEIVSTLKELAAAVEGAISIIEAT